MWREVSTLLTSIGWCLGLLCEDCGSFNHKEHEKEESVENNSTTRVIKGKWVKAKMGEGREPDLVTSLLILFFAS